MPSSQRNAGQNLSISPIDLNDSRSCRCLPENRIWWYICNSGDYKQKHFFQKGDIHMKKGIAFFPRLFLLLALLGGCATMGDVVKAKDEG